MKRLSDIFGVFGRENAQTGLPSRIWFGHNAAAPVGGGLQVQFPRLELVIDGLYRNQVCDASGTVTSCEISAGEALFVPSGCWNAPAWDADAEVVSVLFGALHLGVSRMVWDAASESFTSVEQAHGLIPANGPLHHMANSLSSMNVLVSTESPSALLQCRAIVAHCMGLENSEDSPTQHGSEGFFLAACKYINDNLGSLITRDMVADELNLSASYFSRIFHEHAGTTFSDYLARQRIARACELLRDTEMTLQEIAGMSGFRDFNYFLKVFKKIQGHTPTEYRSSVLRR